MKKITAIEFYGGRCHLVSNSHEIYSESERLARELGGHYMDQFTYAERATDWRSNNNIAESIYLQMAHELHPIPTWVVCSCGTGGTTATIGRYIRYKGHNSQVCVADLENSVFYDAYATDDRTLRLSGSSRIEGIGRPRVELSFIPSIVDRMIKVPNVTSFAALRYLKTSLGRNCGGSTGTNFVATLQLAREMHMAGQTGSIVTILCDSGERYRETYYNDAWLQAHELNISPAYEALKDCTEQGTAMPWSLPSVSR